MPRAAVILLADTDTPEAMGRMANALTTASEFVKAGDEVMVVFDGAGTRWVPELAKADHHYHRLYADIAEQIAGACAYCARAFGVREDIEAAGVRLLDDFNGHPSIHTMVSDGYHVLTF